MMKLTKNALLIALATLTLAITACDKKSDNVEVKPVDEIPAEQSENTATDKKADDNAPTSEDQQAHAEEKAQASDSTQTTTDKEAEEEAPTEQSENSAPEEKIDENAQVNENKQTNVDNKSIVEGGEVETVQNDNDLLAEMEQEALQLADDVK